MKIKNVRSTVIILITLTLCGILVFFFWDLFKAQVVLPLFSFLILINFGIKSVPQGVFLFLLASTCLVFVLNSLNRVFGKDAAEEYTPIVSYGIEVVSRYEFWRNQCSHLNKNSFTHQEFILSTRRLILNILANQEHKEIFEIEQQIKNHELAVPESVCEFLCERRLRVTPPKRNWVGRMIYRIQRLIGYSPEIKMPAALELQVAEIIEFIEYRLEIIYND